MHLHQLIHCLQLTGNEELVNVNLQIAQAKLEAGQEKWFKLEIN
jgi:hypothetical protein